MCDEITIRKVQPEDAEYSIAFRGRAASWRFMRSDTPLPATMESEREAFRNMAESETDEVFSIFNGEEWCGLCKLKNVRNGAAELSYYILNDRMEGRGICKTAVGKMIGHGFESLGLDLQYLYVHNGNVPSMRIAKHYRFAEVGRSLINANTIRLEMTRTGWENQTKNR